MDNDNTKHQFGGRRLLMLLANVRETGILIFILLLVVLVSLRTPNFLNAANFRDILLDISILAVVALGQMMVLLSRGIDLSIGSGIGLSAMAVGMYVSNHQNMSPWLALLMGIGLGIVLGSFVGFVITVMRIPPIITTLGTLSIYRGLVYVVSQGRWVDAHELPAAFKQLTMRPVLGIPSLVIYAAVIVIIVFVFLRYTRLGRKIYAIGSSPEAARLAGIRVDRITFLVYVISGSLYGLAGVFWVSRYAIAANSTALGWELQSVAAAVVGGVSFSGGVGTVPGVLLGSLLIGIINNAVNLVGISPFWKQAFYGLMILFAVIADGLISRRLQRATLRPRTVGRNRKEMRRMS